MSSIQYGDTPQTALGFLPVLAANVLPLAGVVWFGWDPETLVAVYVLELLVVLPLAGVKALFAGKPPASDREAGVFNIPESDLADKRGSVTVHSRLPPVYPRNVPFTVAVVCGGAWIGFLILAPVSEVVSVLDVLGHPEVLLSVVALVVGQVVETVHTYFGSERYAERSPYAVVEIPARQGFLLSCFLFIVAVGGPTSVLVAFVVVKVLFEWSGFRAEHGGGGRLTGWLSGPDSEITADSVNVPAGHPSATIDVAQRSVIADAVWGVVTKGPFYVMLATFVWLGVPAFLGEGAPSLSLWLASGLASLVLLSLLLVGDIVETVLTNKWTTYYRIGDQLVAHDRLTDEPQWTAPVGELRDASVVETRLSDRYFGTRTVTVTTGRGDDETERTLGPLDDPKTFVETFDLQLQSTDLSPLNWWFAGAAVSSVVLIAIGSIVVAATPLGPSVPWVLLPVYLPFLGVVPMGFWKLAHL
ncbi:hypothetical protein C440_16971 [Haloferax mucosum ATCC BAA-1512]|uniref:Uncharacterized protein n=1 Tax=Haloferax mucosum ATCC BAA-1512 TaxID=662479 RepID=M0I0Z8_9EURY|nr:DUF6498-containing protein [Haloferax mucosum]ELZ90391.1 hypothetical protein C440_16971 [Haloferax mucosum ATCC BAA-1512]